MTLTANSGRDVPIATIVTPMKASGKPKFVAIQTALSTIIFHPPIKPTNPSIINTVDFIFDINSIFSSSSEFQFFAILKVYTRKPANKTDNILASNLLISPS
jgi:hypothetical protein